MPILRTVSKNIFKWFPVFICFNELGGTIVKVNEHFNNSIDNKETDKQYILVNRFSVQRFKRSIKPGDIVVLSSPEYPKEKIVRKVIALENEFIEINKHDITEIRQIPKGHICINTYNDNNSSQNELRTVPSALIDSKAIAIIWPHQKFGLISNLFKF